MRVIVAETGEAVNLSLRDLRTGTDWFADLVDSCGGFGDIGDGKIANINGQYRASSDTVAWWLKYIDEACQTDFEISVLADELGIDQDIINELVWDAIGGAPINQHRRIAESVINGFRAGAKGGNDE